MDRENSWLGRNKFSHTVYTRVDHRGAPVAPLGWDVEQKLRRFVSMEKSVSMPVHRDNEDELTVLKHSSSLPVVHSPDHSSSLPAVRSVELGKEKIQLGKEKGNKQETCSSPLVNSENSKSPRARSLVKSPSMMMILGYLNKAQPNQDSKVQKVDGPQHKLRSKSPLPSVAPSDVFREARASSQRFTSPPPKRRGSSRSIYGKSFGREVCPNPDLCSTPVVSDKHKSHKDSSWTKKYFDNGGRRRVSAVDTTNGRKNQKVSMAQAVQTTVDWTLDRSKLLFGPKFAFGACSRLYKGLYDGKPVAIKFIRQPEDDDNGEIAAKLEKQYNSEINSLSHLYHKNVIKLVAAYKDPPVCFIITELLSGGSLRSYLNTPEHHPIPLERIISIALDIAHGLEYIHSQGVVHRDIKPENILFDENFCVKIADFGIACEEALCDVLVEDEGTYRWMAPEMIKRKSYNRKVDVYSFGLILWEMVSGRIPYENLTPMQVAYAVVNRNMRPTVSEECPMAMRSLIEQCCQMQSDKRPDFWQIVKALEQFNSIISQGGHLDSLNSSSTCQDQKKRLLHWFQKLKPSHST